MVVDNGIAKGRLDDAAGRVFHALADATRRDIVARVARREKHHGHGYGGGNARGDGADRFAACRRI